MGAEQSQPARSSNGGDALKQPGTIMAPDYNGQFVLIVTAPPGVGKEGLMGRLISENNGRVGYCAKVGSVTANEKVSPISISRDFWFAQFVASTGSSQFPRTHDHDRDIFMYALFSCSFQYKFETQLTSTLKTEFIFRREIAHASK